MTEQEKLTWAKQRVKAMTCFYIHGAVFVLVITLLFVINLVAGRAWWVQWPFLGWGIGVLAHAWAVFGPVPNPLTRWQAEKARKLADRL